MKAFANLEQEIGQLFMIGISSTELSASEKKWIRKVKPGGIIYFKRNIESPRQLRFLSKEIISLYPSNEKPWIAIDQEGGLVARLRGLPFTDFPGNDYLGRIYQETKDIQMIRDQAKAMIRELRAVGVNFNFTPVADINTNAKNPIIGKRAFGDSASLVSKLVYETVKTYNLEGFMSCAKHFPGHGDTDLDSHLALPLVSTSRRTLLRRELLPFREAVRAKVPSIMTAHVIYKDVDANQMATLSSKILRDWLRRRLKFKGLILSDDLMMKAISSKMSLQEASIRAWNAGVDVLLYCDKDFQLAESAFHEILIRAKELNSKEVLDSVQRVRKARKRYLRGFSVPSERISFKGWKKHQNLAKRITELGKLESA